MTRGEPSIDAEIRRARTLPAQVYCDERYYTLQRERVFARSWQLLPLLDDRHTAVPLTLLEGCLDEPLLVTREGQTLHCLSNVCTHRANLVVPSACDLRQLRCRYHGRRFSLQGRFTGMPEFEQALDFPGPGDDLPRLPLHRWGPLCFSGVAPAIDFESWIEPLRRRLDWIEPARLRLDPATSRDYEIRANWALYCDNYLEGFHIPFVHPGLAATLDYAQYATELFDWASLQLGVAEPGADCFDLPPRHVDHGRNIAAYYFWFFPNLMLNFYPWGLSVNLVEPRGVDRTRIRFLSYVGDESRRGAGAGDDLHTVELEDEEVVLACQAGVRSRLYERGRYSPTRETGVHHFHRLLAGSMAAEGR